jgi:glycosyltransferase involved in cell wall biosynthesis
MFLGRLDPYYKGLDLLLGGFAIAAPADAVLVLVGPDSHGARKTLEAEARRLGIAHQVAFAGPEYGKGKFDLLAGADVFAMCSRSEGLSLAVLEAAGCGVPCLVSDAANPAGLVERCGAGLVVKPEAAGIARGIRALSLMDPDALRRMGRNARAMAEAHFDWSNTARILIGAYEACTGSRASQDRAS